MTTIIEPPKTQNPQPQRTQTPPYSETNFVFIKEPERAAETIQYLDRLLIEREVKFTRKSFQTIRPVLKLPLVFHYQHVFPKYFEIAIDMVLKLARRGVTPFIYTGPEGLCDTIIKCTGDTDPAKAEPWTVRGALCNDSIEKAKAERRSVENLIHRSRNTLEALTEISRFNQLLIPIDTV